jgi:two-component system nitrogen regulation response regulator NtrX
VPSLRERREDIPLLVRNYLEHLFEQERIEPYVFTKEAMDYLKILEWPGNIRQLHNVVERVALLANGPEITKEDVLHFTEKDEHSLLMGRKSEDRNDSIRDFLLKSGTFREFKERSEAWFLEYKLTQYGGNVAKTAEYLGITRSALYDKIKKYSLLERA